MAASQTNEKWQRICTWPSLNQGSPSTSPERRREAMKWLTAAGMPAGTRIEHLHNMSLERCCSCLLCLIINFPPSHCKPLKRFYKIPAPLTISIHFFTLFCRSRNKWHTTQKYTRQLSEAECGTVSLYSSLILASGRLLGIFLDPE
jgi:hypothetical protein